mgnify:CR=1
NNKEKNLNSPTKLFKKAKSSKFPDLYEPIVIGNLTYCIKKSSNGIL